MKEYILLIYISVFNGCLMIVYYVAKLEGRPGYLSRHSRGHESSLGMKRSG
jgi:hypothetical protein